MTSVSSGAWTSRRRCAILLTSKIYASVYNHAPSGMFQFQSVFKWDRTTWKVIVTWFGMIVQLFHKSKSWGLLMTLPPRTYTDNIRLQLYPLLSWIKILSYYMQNNSSTNQYYSTFGCSILKNNATVSRNILIFHIQLSKIRIYLRLIFQDFYYLKGEKPSLDSFMSVFCHFCVMWESFTTSFQAVYQADLCVK